MARPRRDGTPPRQPSRRKLTDHLITNLKAEDQTRLVWDTQQKGFCVSVQPSGSKAYKVAYHFLRRLRWYYVGNAGAISLKDARRIAAKVMLEVTTDRDPQAERQARRGAGTFEELAGRYLDEYAKENNKSWRQAAKLVAANLMPRWAKLGASTISRSDVKNTIAKISSPSVRTQTLAAASAIFSWAIREEIAGIKVNPCQKVARTATTSRERILSDSEVPRFWRAFDSAGLVAGTALKMILLTGQRPGEVRCMRREHIEDGWWTMPGEPVPALKWPGTKNSRTHLVWLPEAAQELIAEMGDGNTGLVFASPRGNPLNGLDAAMRAICRELGVENEARPHDLRRTHGSTITSLGFGRDAMNRVQNHKEGGIADVYDRSDYAKENRRIMEAVARHVMALVEGREGKVVAFAKK